MKKLITYGFVLTLSSLLAFHPVVILALSKASAESSRIVKSALPAKPRRPFTTAKTQTADVAGQTTTLLPDGRLLITGGQDAGGPRTTIAISDPATGEVVPLPIKLNQARAWHSATMLPDGRILLVGGVGSDNKTIANAELVDPAAQTVEVISSPSFARSNHTATVLTDGRVLLVGGVSATGQALTAAGLWDYKTRTETTLTGRLHVARQKQKATLQTDGNVLIEGGVDRNGKEVSGAELFNTQTLSFESPVSSPESITNAYLAGSFPSSDATNVPTDTIIGLRFSRALTVQSINPANVTLNGPHGTVATKIIPAENGRLAFVTPLPALDPGTTYTLNFQGATETAGVLSPSLFSFTTAGDMSNRNTDEDWVPDASNLRGNWRSKPVHSEAQSLPPLQANPDVTALSGQVLTLNGAPLANVSLQIGSISTQTDQTGGSLLTNVATGHQVMRLDGRTANVAGKTYGMFKIGVDITADKTNLLGYTIWMPKLDTAHGIKLQSPTTKQTIVTNPLIPGLELRLPEQTVIRDMNGSTVTELSITPIPTTQPPFPLPAGVNVPVFFTIQPGGSQVIPPRAQLIYPNFTNQPAGARIDFWNYDAEEKGWYVYGQGTVSANGRQIIPDAGVVLYEFTGAMISDPSNAPPDGPEPCSECQDGDPVDLGTGLFVHSMTDLVIPAVIPLSITRTYRPRDTVSRPFGMGTTHPYEIFLVGDFNTYAYIDLVLPDGGRVRYDRLFPGINFDTQFQHTASPGVFYKSILAWNGGGWNLTLRNGTVYTFPDSDGIIGPRHAAMTSMRDRNGNQLTLQRSDGNLLKITSPNGRWIEFTYDTSNRITQARDNIARTVNYTYDTRGRLATVTDPRGGVTQYTYDTSDRLTKITDPKNQIYLTNVYDTNGRITKQTQADSTTYLYAYTIGANGLVSQTDVTDPRGNVRRVTFNTNGYVVSDTFPLGKPEQQKISYVRNATTNQISSMTDGLNRRTDYSYDAQGNTTSVTNMAGTAEAVTTSYTYDPVFSVVMSVTDPLNHTLTFGRDAKGNITTITDPLNHSATIAYNAAGQVTSVTDPMQNTTTYSYDAGSVSRVTDAEGRTMSRFVDDAGRVLAITNSQGNTVRYTYDASNHVTKVTDPNSGATLFTYDPNGNLLTVTDALNNVTTYTYNNMNRIASRKDALLRTQTYLYDANGNMSKYTDRRGKDTNYTYDNLNRLTFAGFGAVVQGQTTNYESTITYTYDAGDRLTRTVDTIAGTMNLGYDNLDRLTSQSSPQGTINYSYDAADRRTSMTVTGQTAVNYTYDNADRLTGITQGSMNVGFAFDNGNRLSTLTLPNGVHMDYTYNHAP